MRANFCEKIANFRRIYCSSPCEISEARWWTETKVRGMNRNYMYASLQRLPLTRALEGFFSPCWNLSFRGRQSTVSMVFSRTLTEKVPSSSLNERTRIISNDDGVLNYFIKMKGYIVKTTRSLRAEWNSRNTLYSLRKGSQVVYSFDWFIYLMYMHQ